jgi:hypothetical protein
MGPQLASAAQLFGFTKFLIAWSVACAVFSLELPGATVFTYGRIFVTLLLVTCIAVAAALRYAFATLQQAYTKLRTAQVMLATEHAENLENSAGVVPLPELNDRLPRHAFMSDPEEMRWWTVRVGLMRWSPMLRNYDYRAAEPANPTNNAWLAAVVKNSANTLWFVLGAWIIVVVNGLSRWLGIGTFVVFASVAIVNCITIMVFAAGTYGRAALVRLGPLIPARLRVLIPDATFLQFTRRTDEKYWLCAAGVRLVEAVCAIVITRLLAGSIW